MYTTLLVLSAAVCHRVRDGQICCWFNESDSSDFSLFIQTRLSLMYPLAELAVSHLRPRFARIIGDYEYARSQGSLQLDAMKPCVFLYVDRDHCQKLGVPAPFETSRRQVLMKSEKTQGL